MLSKVPQNSLLSYILQILFICFQQNKEILHLNFKCVVNYLQNYHTVCVLLTQYPFLLLLSQIIVNTSILSASHDVKTATPIISL